MSEPFVTFEQVGDDPSDCDVLLGGVNVSDIGDLHFPEYAAELDAAVTARERKAAAKALRELAASVRAETGVRAPKPSDPFWRDHFAAMADREADAIEKAAP